MVASSWLMVRLKALSAMASVSEKAVSAVMYWFHCNEVERTPRKSLCVVRISTSRFQFTSVLLLKSKYVNLNSGAKSWPYNVESRIWYEFRNHSKKPFTVVRSPSSLFGSVTASSRVGAKGLQAASAAAQIPAKSQFFSAKDNIFSDRSSMPGFRGY